MFLVLYYTNLPETEFEMRDVHVIQLNCDCALTFSTSDWFLHLRSKFPFQTVMH